MVRTKLWKTFFKNKEDKIIKATVCNEIIALHFCKKVREINNLNEKNICDTKKF